MSAENAWVLAAALCLLFLVGAVVYDRVGRKGEKAQAAEIDELQNQHAGRRGIIDDLVRGGQGIRPELPWPTNLPKTE